MASKKESTFKNMVLVLFIISALSATALAYVNVATEKPIALAKIEKDKKAVGEVVPPFDNDPVKESDTVDVGNGDVIIIYPATLGGKPVGAAIKTFSDLGFSERIKIMVGFDTSGVITGTSVLEHKETPGLGDKMEKGKSLVVSGNDSTWWSKQFLGKKPEFETKSEGEIKVASAINLRVKKDGGDVDAITASTITSRAFCDAVNRAYVYKNKVGELKKKEGQPKAHYVLGGILVLIGVIVILKKIK